MAVGDATDRKTLRHEPALDLCEVAVTKAKPTGVFRRSKPLVVIGKTRALLRLHQRVECSLLL